MRMLLALLALSPLAFADDAKPDAGFELLFNGKDLTGWKPLGKKDSLDGKTEAFKGRFKVKDGELVIDPAVKGDVRIETVREFSKDAVIKFEFYPDEKCNNDLFYRGQKFDLSKANVKNMKVGEWNPIEIAVKDGKVSFTVNGTVVRSAAVKGEKSTFGIRAEFGSIRIRSLQVKEG
ncbi:MAG TPA: DUF1080 domain-containing protein [Urbifossiella sp.]|nr:DUF1080 domain-containing protein [Urbifossiella sp.]